MARDFFVLKVKEQFPILLNSEAAALLTQNTILSSNF